jgi:hypothetical protein
MVEVSILKRITLEIETARERENGDSSIFG